MFHFLVIQIQLGSLTWDALAGKIMFRDIVFTTEDFSLRIQDGWLVFRWWRSYVPRDISEGLEFVFYFFLIIFFYNSIISNV